MLGVSSCGGGVKGGRCVGMTNLPPTRADCVEILGPPTSWSDSSPLICTLTVSFEITVKLGVRFILSHAWFKWLLLSWEIT